MITLISRGLAAAGLLASINMANAIFISNLPQNNDAAFNFIDNTSIKAMGFTVDSNDYILKYAEIRLDTAPGALPVAEVWADSGGSPGGPLHTFISPVMANGIFTYVFMADPGNPFTFLANQTYWLVVSKGGGLDFGWVGSNPGIVPTGTATHFGEAYSTNLGGTWGPSGVLNSFRIECNLVPEPSGILGLAVGVALAVMRRKRRPHDQPRGKQTVTF